MIKINLDTMKKMKLRHNNDKLRHNEKLRHNDKLRHNKKNGTSADLDKVE